MLLLTGIHYAAAMERFDLVTTQELEQMLNARQKGELDFLLVNVLDEIVFRNVTIPGSINIPWNLINEKVHLLGDDPDKLIITHCMGYR
jgi:rhodanese-related sulfurtransferase